MNTKIDYVVVVGVDGSDAAAQALAWAIQEAADQGGMVYAVTAWRADLPNYGLHTTDRRTHPKQYACRTLERAVAAAGCRVPVAGEVVEGRPAEVLRAASRDADLLVLGSDRPAQLLRQPVPGAVAAECLRSARCPVMVIPAPSGAADHQPTGAPTDGRADSSRVANGPRLTQVG